MDKKKIIASAAIVVAIALGITFTSVGGKFKQEEQVNLIFSNVTSSAAKEAGLKFKDLVEQYSDGTVTVDVFQDNQLGDDKTSVEGVQVGDIDIAVASTSSLSTMYKNYYLFDTPYLFLNSQEVYDIAFNGKAGTKIMEGVSDVKLRGMAMWENGFRNYTNNAHTIRLPEDVKGQKIRTMENDIHLKAWSAIGANPTPMAFSELFTAMQQGTVDGEENPIGIIVSNRFYEVQKYISLTQHVYTPYCVVMNPQKYEALNDQQKQAVDRAMKEATQFQIELSQEEEQAALAQMEDFGCEVTALSDEEKQEFQKIVEDKQIFDFAKSKMTHPEYFEEMEEELKTYREGAR